MQLPIVGYVNAGTGAVVTSPSPSSFDNSSINHEQILEGIRGFRTAKSSDHTEGSHCGHSSDSEDSHATSSHDEKAVESSDDTFSEESTQAHVCTACRARLEVNEVRERQADLDKAEGHGRESGRLVTQRGSRKADIVREAFTEADKACDIYARCLVPHISLRRYDFLTRLVEECVQIHACNA